MHTQRDDPAPGARAPGPWSLARALGTAFVVLALSGCGGSDTSAGEPSAGDDGATDGTSQPAASQAASATSAPTGPVLTVDDLPEGWSEVPADDSGPGGDSCLDRLAAPGGPFDPATARTLTFAGGAIGPFLAASVVERPAERVLPSLDQTLVGCDGQTSGSGFTTSIEPVQAAGLPPGALAVRGSDTTSDGSGVRYVVTAAGTGAASVMVVGVTPLGEVDETLVADALATALARLPGA